MNGGVAVRQHGVAAYWRARNVTSPRHQKIRELARPGTEGRAIDTGGFGLSDRANYIGQVPSGHRGAER